MADGGWLDGVTSWIGNNSSWLKPVVNAGIGAYGYSQQKGTQSAYLDALKQSIQNDYNTQKQNSEDYKAWLEQNAAASNANSRARAAAARQEEKNRQKALRNAMKEIKSGYDKSMSMYQPYIDAGNAILPKATANINQAFDTASMLNAYLMSPQNMSKLNGAAPVWQQDIPLPNKVKNGN